MSDTENTLPDRTHRTAAIVVRIFYLLIIVASIGAIIYFMKILPEKKYDEAILLLEAGDVEQADAMMKPYWGFHTLSGKDEYADLKNSFKVSKPDLSSAKKGDIVTVGYYEQDGYDFNGLEPIEWIVLEREGDNLFLVTKKCIDAQYYNDDFTGIFEEVSYYDSNLDSWLNTEFWNTTFSDAERTMILNASGASDPIFVLNEAEFSEYFTTDNKKKCEATPYAKSKGKWALDSVGWVTSSRPDGWFGQISYVTLSGKVEASNQAKMIYYVRPAMRISVK